MSAVHTSLAVLARKLAPLLRKVIVPVDNIVYASPTGTDTAAGTQASPVSLTEALRRLSAGWTRYGVLYLANGLYSLPANTVLNFPKGSGSGAMRLQIIANWIDGGDGPMTATAISTYATGSPATITVAGKAWPVDFWTTTRVRFLGNSGGGSIVTTKGAAIVMGNTNNTLKFASVGGVNFTGLPDFVIEYQGAAIDWGASPPSFIGGDVLLRGVMLLGDGSLKNSVEIALEGGILSRKTGGATSFGVTCGGTGSLVAGAVPTGFRARAATDAVDALDVYTTTLGMVWTGGSTAFNSLNAPAHATIANSLLENFVLSSAIYSSGVSISGCWWRGRCASSMRDSNSTCWITSNVIDTITNANTGALAPFTWQNSGTGAFFGNYVKDTQAISYLVTVVRRGSLEFRNNEGTNPLITNALVNIGWGSHVFAGINSGFGGITTDGTGKNAQVGARAAVSGWPTAVGKTIDDLDVVAGDRQMALLSW